MNRAESEIKLKRIFGHKKFYDNQWIVIDRLFKGERVLLIEKTGYGKSLCFQFPATQFPGTTIIFSPLIALMREQVNKLNSLSINARCINSNHCIEENARVIEDARSNRVKILYIAPERMENLEWIQSTREMNISMVVVDEAHCISTWGHDFRPSYKRIINLVNLLPANFPVLATTATATKRVEKDIIEQIGNNISSVRGNLLRPNLKLRVIKVNSEEEKLLWIGEHLIKLEGTGVIYSGTQANTEIYSRWLQFLKINSTGYNASLDADTRIAIENGFINNRYKCVVSTNALGMGIDKPDIRFIIHTQVPVSPIHYYQEIGRAGRDGKESLIFLFYNPELDLELPLYFIDNGKPPIDNYYKVIDVLKKERLNEFDLIRQTNLKQTQVKVIKADLIHQGIINEVYEERRKLYEYKFNAPKINTKSFEELRDLKLKELEDIINYVNTGECRMNFLCEYLGDEIKYECGACDVDLKKEIKVLIKPEWKRKLDEFQNNYFPLLEVEGESSNIVNGVAGSFYGISNVGQIIHKCKYETGDKFPDFLLKLVVRAFNKHYSDIEFDLLISVPPTISGNLVSDFSKRLSKELNIPFSKGLTKKHKTKPQKMLNNWLLKTDNIKNTFEYNPSEVIKGKKILLIDDIADSCITLKEIGRYFTFLGAELIAPLVIAKTVGGDI